MPSQKELEQRLADLERLVAQAGIVAPRPEWTRDVTSRPDYVEFGSERHMALLGLVEVEDPDAAKEEGYIVHRSPRTGRIFRLEDQVTAFMNYPDPAQVARLVLTQKVNVLEAGKPPVPENAPPLWNPNEM